MIRVVSVGGRMGTGKSSASRLLEEWNRHRAWRYAVVSSGDIVRSLPQTAETKEEIARTGLDPRETTVRRRIVEAVLGQADAGVQIVLLDGFPRTAEQWDFARGAGILDRYILIDDARSVDFIKARKRDDLEHELRADRAQAELLDALATHAAGRGALRHQGDGFPLFIRLNTTGWTVRQVALHVDRIARATFEKAALMRQSDPCQFCAGVGLVLMNAETEPEPCGFCNGTGREDE
jgi:adenylate kinase family enzyme